ncbi:MAG: trigger factor [Candidatus Sungbacteria bacterium]|uniref:Trigger factor n=1 Tax=Candidatus Sungiibacteriota bacterium TaxID=2750080 RepID=A0A933DTG6_9BACT|nr:trigger factor [Candidatus Sungbacteria bacterium]
MTYTIEKPSQSQVVIIVHAPHMELSPFLPKAAEAISQETEIEGFRKGKAPYEVVKQRVGEFKILEEAARLHIRKNFRTILEDIENQEYKGKSFEPVGEPQVALTKLAPGADAEYTITLWLLPAFALPDYRAIAKQVLEGKKVPPVTEEEVQSSLRWLRESRASLVAVRRGASVGDRVEIDFSASHGGVTLHGGESKNHPFILGQDRFLPGFEENLLGMKSGDEKTFALAVPPDWRDTAIAGRSLEFRVKINSVQERIVPEWNDAFAKSMGNFPSIAAVEKSIRDGLALEKERQEQERLRLKILDAVANQAGIELPEPIIERELEKMTAELRDSLAGMGLAFEDYLAAIKKSGEALKKEWRPEAERRARSALVLREIARREKIQPTAEEIELAAGRITSHRGLAEENRPSLDSDEFRVYAQGVARNEKVFKFLEELTTNYE